MLQDLPKDLRYALVATRKFAIALEQVKRRPNPLQNPMITAIEEQLKRLGHSTAAPAAVKRKPKPVIVLPSFHRLPKSSLLPQALLASEKQLLRSKAGKSTTPLGRPSWPIQRTLTSPRRRLGTPVRVLKEYVQNYQRTEARVENQLPPLRTD